jgi:SAM-dependent methyltransferase
MQNPNIQFYNDEAASLSLLYNELDTTTIHGAILPRIKPGSNILDVGCGSGRDAHYFACRGHSVTAVDPAEKLLAQARADFRHPNLKFQTGRLPEPLGLSETFDYILLSAVWMHIPLEDRKASIESLVTHLAPNGQIFISLRYGPFDDARQELPVSTDEVRQIAQALNCTVEVVDSNNADDQLNRPEISWETVIIQQANRACDTLLKQ